jgi:hypothetical protein
MAVRRWHRTSLTRREIKRCSFYHQPFYSVVHRVASRPSLAESILVEILRPALLGYCATAESKQSQSIGSMAALVGSIRPMFICRCGYGEERELERPADGQYVLFCEDQFAGPLLVGTQHSLLAHARHGVARIADSAQRAAVFGRQRTVLRSIRLG